MIKSGFEKSQTLKQEIRQKLLNLTGIYYKLKFHYYGKCE